MLITGNSGRQRFLKYFKPLFLTSFSLLFLVSFFVMSSPALAAPQAFDVFDKTPGENEEDVSADSNIVVQFSMEVNFDSIDSGSFNVVGSTSGTITGGYTLTGADDTITFDPGSDYSYGETVTVTLTTDIQSSFGPPLEDEVTWNFTVEDAPVPPLPELPTLALIGSGLVIFVVYIWFRQKKQAIAIG